MSRIGSRIVQDTKKKEDLGPLGMRKIDWEKGEIVNGHGSKEK